MFKSAVRMLWLAEPQQDFWSLHKVFASLFFNNGVFTLVSDLKLHHRTSLEDSREQSCHCVVNSEY